jgi:hypothetical protein
VTDSWTLETRPPPPPTSNEIGGGCGFPGHRGIVGQENQIGCGRAWSPMMAYVGQTAETRCWRLSPQKGCPLNPPRVPCISKHASCSNQGRYRPPGLAQFFFLSAERQLCEKETETEPAQMPTYTCGRSGGWSGALIITQTFLGAGLCIEIPRKSKANHPQPGSSGEGVGVHFRQRGSLPGKLALELGREGINGKGHGFAGFPLAN